MESKFDTFLLYIETPVATRSETVKTRLNYGPRYKLVCDGKLRILMSVTDTEKTGVVDTIRQLSLGIPETIVQRVGNVSVLEMGRGGADGDEHVMDPDDDYLLEEGEGARYFLQVKHLMRLQDYQRARRNVQYFPLRKMVTTTEDIKLAVNKAVGVDTLVTELESARRQLREAQERVGSVVTKLAELTGKLVCALSDSKSQV